MVQEKVIVRHSNPSRLEFFQNLEDRSSNRSSVFVILAAWRSRPPLGARGDAVSRLVQRRRMLRLHINYQHLQFLKSECIEFEYRSSLSSKMSLFLSTGNQESLCLQELPLSDPHLSLSPQRPPPSYGHNGRKERRNPSITPKKFSRFFTPRSQMSREPSRRVFNDITAPSNNRRAFLSSPIQFCSIAEKGDIPSTYPRDLKRRKLFYLPDETPDHTSEDLKGDANFEVLQEADLENVLHIQSSPCERAAQLEQVIEEEEDEEEAQFEAVYAQPLQRIISIDQRGLGGNLLQSTTGLAPRSRRQHCAYPVNGKLTEVL